jgi:antitoxin component YwqK of YwqJK toxin-antitoxin module
MNQDQLSQDKPYFITQYHSNGNIAYYGMAPPENPIIRSGWGTSYHKHFKNIKEHEGFYKDNELSWPGKTYDILGNLVSNGTWDLGNLSKLDTSKFDRVYFESLQAVRSSQKKLLVTTRNPVYRVRYYRSSIYFGEFKNEKKNGIGLEFTVLGKKMYFGQFLDGKKTGFGITYSPVTSLEKYVGELSDGKRSGHGYYNYHPEDILKGLLKLGDSDTLFDEKIHGEISSYCNKKKYEGDWGNGQPNGFGTKYNKTGNVVYKGFWKDGDFHGRGTEFIQAPIKSNIDPINLSFLDGGPEKNLNSVKTYEGSFEKNVRHGFGTLYDSQNGDFKFSGQWQHGLLEEILLTQLQINSGLTTKAWYDIVYLGGFNEKTKKRHGNGVEYNKKGQVMFEGNFLNGLANGYCKEFRYSGSLLYKGLWKDGEKSGRGIEYKEDGGLRYEGTFFGNLRSGFGIEYYSCFGKETRIIKFEGMWFKGEKQLGKLWTSDGVIERVGTFLHGQSTEGCSVSYGHGNGKAMYTYMLWGYRIGFGVDFGADGTIVQYKDGK